MALFRPQVSFLHVCLILTYVLESIYAVLYKIHDMEVIEAGSDKNT